MATKTEKLQELAKNMMEEKAKIEKTLYYDDFLRAFKEVVAYVKDIEKRLSETNASNKDSLLKELNDKATSILGDIETARKGLDTRFATIESTINKDMLEFQALFSELKDELKSEMPEEYDDEEISNRIKDVSDRLDALKIPTEFDATELTQEIDQLKKDVDELKKRPVGGSGGRATALQVASLFKYIAFTEQPSGAIDGVNTTYTVKNNIFWVAGFTLNGEQIAQLPNFTVSGRTITFSSAIPADYSGKDFEVKYIGS